MSARYRRFVPSAVAITVLVTAAIDVTAQVRRGRQPEVEAGWAPVSVGVLAGYDQQANGEILGGQLRIPVVRDGTFEVVPNVGATFLPGVREYQYSAEVSWVPGGRRGGFFLTGGVGWRDTVIGSDLTTSSRDTLFGYVAGAGFEAVLGPLLFEVGLRWIFLDDTGYRPNPVTLGVSYPLWSAVPDASSGG